MIVQCNKRFGISSDRLLRWTAKLKIVFILDHGRCSHRPLADAINLECAYKENYDGKVHLEKIIPTDKPLKVVVVFEEDIEQQSKRLQLSDFSFEKSRELLKDVKGSFSEEFINERREAL